MSGGISLRSDRESMSKCGGLYFGRRGGSGKQGDDVRACESSQEIEVSAATSEDERRPQE